MDFAIVAVDGIKALDAVGPYEVLWPLPCARVRFVATEAGLKRDPGAFALLAEYNLDEVPRPDVVVVPGGKGARAAVEDEALLDWLREAQRHSRWTTSVFPEPPFEAGSPEKASEEVVERVRRPLRREPSEAGTPGLHYVYSGADGSSCQSPSGFHPDARGRGRRLGARSIRTHPALPPSSPSNG